MTKKALRLKYKKLRQNLVENDVDERSLLIANQVLTMNIWNNSYFHVFLPIKTQNEVNTEFILHILQGKDKEIIVSKSNFETIEMKHFLLTDSTKIKTNEYNIPEPISGLEVAVKNIEVVFVPLLAFDNQGNRIGYGKGFYDKFLSECEPKTIKIGLSFFEPDATFNEVCQNDIKLDYCVTPTNIFEF